MRSLETQLDDLLKATSRAFYLSLVVLPPKARTPLSLAYLLARAADTIADAEADSQVDRANLLMSLKERFATPSSWTLPVFPEIHPTSVREQELLNALPVLFEQLQARPETEQLAISRVVSTLIDGMIWDQRLFAGSEWRARVEVGLDDEEFETYTFLVAGCVGPFWSRICVLSDPHLQHLQNEDNDTVAAEFGRGLQWVNILRDVPQDHLNGRFYLPELEAPGFFPRFLSQGRRALTAFSSACRYPLLFPFYSLRHRLAVFWPLVLGLRTLEKLFERGGPRPGERVKVQRWEVFAWVGLSPLLVVSDALMMFVLDGLRRRAERALDQMEDHQLA